MTRVGKVIAEQCLYCSPELLLAFGGLCSQQGPLPQGGTVGGQGPEMAPGLMRTGFWSCSELLVFRLPGASEDAASSTPGLAPKSLWIKGS